MWFCGYVSKELCHFGIIGVGRWDEVGVVRLVQRVEYSERWEFKCDGGLGIYLSE